jgi:hypothetical protein
VPLHHPLAEDVPTARTYDVHTAKEVHAEMEELRTAPGLALPDSAHTFEFDLGS